MRREERVTVQGPVKEQQPDGMSHRGVLVLRGDAFYQGGLYYLGEHFSGVPSTSNSALECVDGGSTQGCTPQSNAVRLYGQEQVRADRASD